MKTAREVVAIIKSTTASKMGLRIYLFIKKSDGEGSDFYYMGRVNPIEWTETTIANDKGHTLPIMNFKMELEHEVRNDIYDYFIQ